ncbi:aldo/keto reductase [Luminiphilus sp.]|nr:aldo/keto reductase [Luminiphilus sp.]
MKLALGTAQFGLHYGVANTQGKVGHSSAREIITYCRSKGIRTLDTAIAYGESEQCLGDIGVGGFDIVTKLPSLPDGTSNIEGWVIKEVTSSISRLDVKSLDGLLLHRPEQLLGRNGGPIVAALIKLKDAGIIRKFGVSVYSPEELPSLFSVHDFDLVQCPFNLVDRRLVSSGWLEKLNSLGVEVHVRSSFLQGLLLMPRGKIPQYFWDWDLLWDRWYEWLNDHNVSPIDACLAYVFAESNVDKVIVGVDSKIQLKQIVAFHDAPLSLDFPDISSQDARLLNPSNWKI